MKSASRHKRKKTDADRLRQAVAFGKRWKHCYWRETFSHDGREVLVAEIPLNWLQRIEREDLEIDQAVEMMVQKESHRSKVNFSFETYLAYRGLWDEAVNFALGVRKDARRAWVYGEYSLVLFSQSRPMEAFHVAKQAFDTEVALASHTRFWHRLLYTLAEILVRSGYGDEYPILRPYAQASNRPTSRRRTG